MRKLPICFIFVLALFALADCISHYSVTKVTAGTNPRGLRVNLPAPFIVGKPSPDGTIKYSVELLPDPDQEYAIDAWALMAKQKMEIARTIEMYVQKMSLAQDTTAVAAQLASSAGAVGKNAVDNLLAQQQANTAAVSAKEADVATKKTTLEKAVAELAAANEALTAAEASGDAAAVKSAKSVVATKEIAVTEAKIDLAAAKGALAARSCNLPVCRGTAHRRDPIRAGQFQAL
jgi:hypothetical protein